MCIHQNISRSTSSDWESVCADCGNVVNEKWQENSVLASKAGECGAILLLEITNADWDEVGRFAIAEDCGFNPVEGFNEWHFRYFDRLEDAYAAFCKK